MFNNKSKKKQPPSGRYWTSTISASVYFFRYSAARGRRLVSGVRSGIWQCAQGAPQAGARIAVGECPFGQLPVKGPHPPPT